MHVFVTGATGFIGSAVVRELLGAGHTVLGLARNDAAAAALARAGVAAHRGDLTDPDRLAAGACACDGIIHTAYIHDFSQMRANAAIDRAAIEAMGAALAGRGGALVIASGLIGLAPGRVSTEEDLGDPDSPTAARRPSELATVALAEQGVRSSVVRLPPSVHGEGDHGFVPIVIGVARARGVSAYVGDGASRWPSVHRLDAARLFRLALEKGAAGSRFHAVHDTGVAVRDIAAVIGRHLDLPVVSKSPAEAGAHFGFLGAFLGADSPSSSAQTRQALGWSPAHSSLLADLDAGHYFAT